MLRLLTLILLLCLQTVDGAALRVAIPPAPGTTRTANPDRPALVYDVVLANYLQTKLERLAGVRIIDGPWSSAILHRTGPQRLPMGQHRQERFAAVLPVDLVVEWTLQENALAVTLASATSLDEFSVPLTAHTSLNEIINQIVPPLAAALQLSPAERDALLVSDQVPANLFRDTWFSHSLGAEWVNNSGEARLKLLRPHLGQMGQHRDLVEAMLTAGILLSTDTRALLEPTTDLEMMRLALPLLLDTDLEPLAFRFLAVNRLRPEAFAEQLMEWAEPLGKDSIDNLFDEPTGAGGPAMGVQPLPAGDGLAALVQAARTPAQQRGALRCLGVLKAPQALPLMIRCAGMEEALTREAAAFGLGHYPPETQAVTATLQRLARDTDRAVAFTAALALFRQEQAPETTLILARHYLAAGERLPDATEVMASLAERNDVEALRNLVDHYQPVVRKHAVTALLRLGEMNEQALLTALNDTQVQVVLEVLARLPETASEAVRDWIGQLANQPYLPIAEQARRALAPWRPAGDAGIAHDLAVEHTYIRRQHLAQLAAAGRHDVVIEQLHNADSHTRAMALLLVAEVNPEAAMRALEQLLVDPSRWVQLHAAATAAMIADERLVPAILEAGKLAPDAATQAWLADALAKAEGRPLPEPPPPVRLVDPLRNHPLLCGFGEFVRESPMEYYYNLNTGLNDAAREAQAAGKIMIGRANHTVKNAGHVILNPYWEEQFWLGLQADMANLDHLDGILYGEESMYTRPWTLWESGWRLFCLDAGLDPEQVRGDRATLNIYQTRAYLVWEERRTIDGLNLLYDYTKLSYGKLRPGFQVATYLPDQDGPKEADFDWKFDIGGAYAYGSSTRAAQLLIRRQKTIWPERPVQWLSLGNGPAGLNHVRYTTPRIETPMPERHTRSYADSVAAWLAGADTGWFSIWLFVHKDMKDGPNAAGKWVQLEDIGPASTIVGDAIEHVFRGVDDVYRLEAEGAPKPTAMGDRQDLDFALDEYDPEKDPIVLRIRRERSLFDLSFQLVQQHVFDAARALTGLPRDMTRPPILLLGPARVAAAQLPPHFDYLIDINKVTRLDLSAYRLIITTTPANAPLRDSTIAALSAWLKTTEGGVLLVSGDLSPDNRNEASTPEDHDGILANDWPWEADLTLGDAAYVLAGNHTAPLDGNSLVLWSHPEYRGKVLFDAANRPAAELRKHLAELGIDNLPPPGIETATLGGVTGATTSHANASFQLTGVELYTMEPNPVVGGGRSAALVADAFQSTYVASYNGVAVLTDQPIESVEPVEGGLRIRCAGLIKTGSISGKVAISLDDLPRLEEQEAINRWLLHGDQPGIAELPIGDSGATATYIRTPHSLMIRVQP